MPKILIGLCVLKMHVEMSLLKNIELNKGQLEMLQNKRNI